MNPIRKERGPKRFRRRWYAVCPECNEKIPGNDLYRRSTRKIAKDALHRHKKQEH